MSEPEQPGRERPEVVRGAGFGNGVEQFVRSTLRQIRRLAVLVVGLTVVLIGLIMFVTPGPGLVVVPIGLAILAIEFVWARRLLHQVRDRAARLRDDYWRRDGTNPRNESDEDR
ncbi:MAG: PGPGW domain-containing protein [Halofilum sp. (in: g-proteobacteria)]|nr:PGPGW domain-containing protein [Halofilum sp. (in: g-proteobacteria)]